MAHILEGGLHTACYTDLDLEAPAVVTARPELAARFPLAALHGLEEGAFGEMGRGCAHGRQHEGDA
jgi:hypothetical protein